MLLALTGGIATGKSTFRQLLAARHSFVVFDADACVHELLSADRPAIDAVVQRFGAGVLGLDGCVSRPALRSVVFHDPAARRDLEQILHPLVRARWQEQRGDCLASGRDFLADIPLLFETSAEAHFDASVLVAASAGTQRARLAARGLDPATMEAMLASQLPLGEKIARATSVVWNDGTPAALGRQADLLLKRLSLLQPCRT
ncbi:MAG: dephospho-CoA kinase [Chthoniobacterales bacterium]